MTVEQLRSLRLANPFRKFYILFNDGQTLLVEEPQQLGIATDGSHMMYSHLPSPTAHHRPSQSAHQQDCPTPSTTHRNSSRCSDQAGTSARTTYGSIARRCGSRRSSVC